MSWEKMFDFYRNDVPQHIVDAINGTWENACKVFHGEKVGTKEKEAAYIACLHTKGYPFQRMPMLPIKYFEVLGV
jgi:hypothetical protein